MLEKLKNEWDKILESLKQEYELSDTSFNTWIKPLEVYSVEGNIITLLAFEEQVGPSGINFIVRKYKIALKATIQEILGQEFDIQIILSSDIDKINKKVNKKTYNTPPKYKNKIYEKYPFLNPRYTFDTFVVGENNKMAQVASLAVAEAPAEIYNPLFIYGGAGLGKTHLMHSIAYSILKNNPDSKVLYVTSEKFTNELIESIRNENTTPAEFREKYRNIDVLLIDDIQFIIGKERTQEEFFHTFNTLYSAKKQIIISSDKHPNNIKTLEERLRSRFASGLTVDIKPPDYETRMAILKNKNELDNLKMSDEIMQYIANNIESNIRELEGALTKVNAYARLQNQEITMSLAKSALNDLISNDTNTKCEITIDLIIDIVSEHFNITAEDIISSKKSRKIAYPRQICMYFCRELTELSLTQIGKAIGNRDHTTVLHGYEKIVKDLKTKPELKKTISVLIKKINPQ